MACLSMSRIRKNEKKNRKLELRGNHSEAAGSEVNTQMSTAFLYASNEQ